MPGFPSSALPGQLLAWKDGEWRAASLKLDDLAAPDDNADLNASAAKHGLMPKLSGVAADVFKGDGTWGAGSSGDGGINYITNGKAETDTTGWATYADAAAASPVDGTGGAPTTTWTRSTSSPLRGIASFLLTKDAANRRGEGASYAFSIDAADCNKSLTITLDLAIASGTYASGDVSLWVYDVTGAKLSPISGSNSLAAAGTVTLQFSSGPSNSYRLIIHVASTSALAYRLQMDNISVSPTYLPGMPAMSDWQDAGAITPGAVTTPPTLGTIVRNKHFYKRLGDSGTFRYELEQSTGGTAGSGDYLYSLPAGLSFGPFVELYTGVATASAFARYAHGIQSFTTDGSSSAHVGVVPYDATRFRVCVAQVVGGVIGFQGSTVYPWSVAAQKISIEFTAQIQGWAGTTAVQPGSRYLWAQRYGAGTRVTSTPSKPGEYRSYTRAASGIVFTDAAPTVPPSAANGILLKGGEPWGTADPAGEPSKWECYIGPGKVFKVESYRDVGRTGHCILDIYPEATSIFGSSVTYDQSTGVVVVQKALAGPATTGQYPGRGSDFANLSDIYFDILVADDPVPVALAPAVHVEASSNAGQVLTANVTALQYEDETTDTHGAWSSNAFTAPVRGVYLVHATGGGKQHRLIRDFPLRQRILCGARARRAGNRTVVQLYNHHGQP